ADRLAVQAELARIGGGDARENLDQGRLAGPVLPHQGMHFAGAEPKVHARQGEDSGEASRQPARFEDDIGVAQDAGQYLRFGNSLAATSIGKMPSCVTMRLGSVLPAFRSLTACISCRSEERRVGK